MKKIIKLTENDLVRLVKRVISEQENTGAYSWSSGGNQTTSNVVSTVSSGVNVTKPSFEKEHNIKKTTLTPQGCAQVRYYLDDFGHSVNPGDCFKKNINNEKLNGNNYYPEYKNFSSDVFFDAEPERRYHFFCDKSKSPLKTHLIEEVKKGPGYGKPKKWMYNPISNNDLEIALKKYAC